MGLEHFEGLLDEVSKHESLTLGVLNLVAQVAVALLEEIHNGEDLTVVGDEGFADSVTAGHEGLQDLKGNSNNLGVAGVESSYTHKFKYCNG